MKNKDFLYHLIATFFFCIIIIGSLMAISSLLFWYKKFDLIKKYYDEKNEK